MGTTAVREDENRLRRYGAHLRNSIEILPLAVVTQW